MERYLVMALGVASTSTCRYKHGAVIVKHGKVLATATNKTRNNPKYIDWRQSSVHAEIAALRKAGWPKRATVYVARTNNQGEARLSKPCATCQEVLDSFRCKVVFT